MSRLFDGFDMSLPQNHTGMRWHIRDNDDGTTTIGCEQDVSDILDHNQQLASANDGWSSDKTFRRVASIPFVVLEDWKNLGADFNDEDAAKWVMKQLNSNEYYKLRTADFKV